MDCTTKHILINIPTKTQSLAVILTWPSFPYWNSQTNMSFKSINCYIVCVCCIISSAPREAFPNFIVCEYNDNKGLLFYFYFTNVWCCFFFCFVFCKSPKKRKPYCICRIRNVFLIMQVYMQTYYFKIYFYIEYNF